MAIRPHQQFMSCIEACNHCAVECDHCASHCLDEKDIKALARCIALDLDCAQMCRTAASMMSRGSELYADICQACAEVCDACGDECDKFQALEHCRTCAAACRKCADECRRMAGAVMAGKGRAAGITSGAHTH